MKKILYILLLALVLTGCGKVETNKKDDNKKTDEVVQSEIEGNEEDAEAGEESGEEVESTEETPENSTQTPEITQPTVTKTTMYAKSSVNVRSGAGTSHSKVGSLAKGQEVTKVGEENGWSKIEFNGGVGYVSSKYLSTEKVETSSSNAGNKTDNNTTSNPNNGGSTNTGNNHTTTNQNTETPVHEHSWEPIKEEKTVYYAWRTICGKCKTDLTDMSSDDRVFHTAAICHSGYSTHFIEVDFVTENPRTRVTIVGYKCSCGATKEGSGESWIQG